MRKKKGGYRGITKGETSHLHKLFTIHTDRASIPLQLPNSSVEQLAELQNARCRVVIDSSLACGYTPVHTDICLFICARVCVCVCVCVYVCANLCVRACVCACVCMCVRTCVL